MRDGRSRFLVAVVLLAIFAGGIAFIAFDTAERCPHCLRALEHLGQTEDGKPLYRYCRTCEEWSTKPKEETRP